MKTTHDDPGAPIGTIVSPGDLGANIRARRRELGLTLHQLADFALVGVRFLSELERGKPTAAVGKVLQVLGSLGLEVRVSRRGERR
jgi:y4mF family transcriptional regulator